MEAKIYQAYYDSKISTVSVIDKFYEYNDNDECIYEQINLNNFFEVILRKKSLSVGICIKRYMHKGRFISCGMTFTELKKFIGSKTYQADERVYNELADEAINAINRYENCFDYRGIELPLENPIRFEAQCSIDRRGFGRIDDDYSKLYGETDHYLITAIYVSTEPISKNFMPTGKYYSFNRIVEMFHYTNEEAEEYKKRYKGIENKFVFVEIDGTVVWDKTTEL